MVLNKGIFMSIKMNEERLKKHLGINNWRELSKDKLYDFIRLSPNIDKEVGSWVKSVQSDQSRDEIG